MSSQRRRSRSKASPGSLEDQVGQYAERYEAHDAREVERRRQEYAQIADTYYNLVTDFYEYGWGRQFHFAVRVRGDTLATALDAHERFLAEQLRPIPGSLVLDVGCGVGGPLMNIAGLTASSVIGVNINRYQLQKARKYIENARLGTRCTLANADFLYLPFRAESLPFAYAIESTCHAPTLLHAYSEVFRVLEPKGLFALYEWALTDQYTSSSHEDTHIKQEIETGNGIPSLVPRRSVDDALTAAGFHIQFSRDRALDCDPQTPWFSSLSGKSLSDRVRRSPFGFLLTHLFVRLAESFHALPKGTSAVSSMLIRSAYAHIEGGRLGIFTPMYFVLAQKPG